MSSSPQTRRKLQIISEIAANVADLMIIIIMSPCFCALDFFKSVAAV